MRLLAYTFVWVLVGFTFGFIAAWVWQQEIIDEQKKELLYLKGIYVNES